MLLTNDRSSRYRYPVVTTLQLQLSTRTPSVIQRKHPKEIRKKKHFQQLKPVIVAHFYLCYDNLSQGCEEKMSSCCLKYVSSK